MTRRLVVLAVLLATSLGVVHLPVVQSAVLHQALLMVRQRTGVVVVVRDLSYNLLTLEARVHGVAATLEETGTPFLTVEDAYVNLPWRAVFSGLAIERVDVRGLTLDVVRDEAGRLNIPSSDGGATALSPRRVPVGALGLARVTARYRDLRSGLRAGVENLDLELSPTPAGLITGGLTTGSGPFVRTAGLAVDGTLRGTVGYDGSSLILTGLTYTASPGRLRIDGRLDSLWSTPTVHASVAGTVGLPEMMTMLGLDAAVEGAVAMSATVEAPLAAPAATVTLTSERLRWRHLAPRTLTATLAVDSGSARVDQASLQLGEGVVTASGRLSFESQQTVAAVAWRRVPVGALLEISPEFDIAALLTGRADIAWKVGDGLRGVTARADTHADVVRGTRGITVGGDAQLRVADGRWSLSGEQVVADGASVRSRVSGRLNEVDLGASLLEGAVTVSAAIPNVVPLLGRLGVSLPGRLESGRLDAALRLGGTMASPRASGQADLDDVRVAGSQPLSARLPFTASRTDVLIDGARVAVGNNVVAGDAEARLDSGVLHGELDVRLSDFDALGPSVAAWHPRASLVGHIALDGTMTSPNVQLSLSGANISVANQLAEQVTLDVAYAAGVVRAPSVILTQADGGRATARGTYALDSGQVELALHANAWRVTPVESPAASWPVGAVLDADLDISGTWERPAGGGTVAATELRWNDMRLSQADLDLALSGAGVSAHLQVPELALRADATVDHRAPYAVTLAATAEETSLAALLGVLGPTVPSFPTPLDGVVSASLDGVGTLEDPSTLSADLRLSRLDVHSGSASLRLARPAAARYDARTLAVTDLRLESGATTVDVSGELSPSSTAGLSLTVRGLLDDVGPWLVAAGVVPEVVVGGTLTGALGASGSLDRLALRGELNLDGGQVAWPGHPAVTGISTTITLADNMVSVPAFRAKWEDAEATGRVRVPLRFLSEWLPASVTAGLPVVAESATAQARFDNVTPTALAALTGEDGLESLLGHASLELDLLAHGATLDAVSGTLVMSELVMSAEGLPIEQVRPTRLDLNAGTVRVADWTWTVAGGRLDIAGGAGLTGDRPVDLTVNGRLDLRVLGAFIPGIAAGGAGDLAVSVRGPAASAVASGSVQLRDGELRLSDAQIALSNLNGQITLQPNRLDIPGIRGDLNGGPVAVIGGLSYQGLTITAGTLSIQAEDVALNVPQGLRTEVDSSLAVTFGDRVQLSGQVEIVRGAYREPLSLAVGLAAATRRGLGASAGAAGADSVLERIDLNVGVASDEDLVVDNNYGRMDLGLDVRIVGTAFAPSIVGRATIREGGVLFLGGRSYLIDRGVIDFSNPRVIVPELDLQARTRIRGTNESGALQEYDITVAIAGTPETVTATLSSDPPRGQADIVSLLATGRLADQAGGAGAAVAREQALGYLTGDALAFAAQAIGVDAIRFERDPGVEALTTDPSLAAEVNPVQRLTFSRRLSGSVEVVLSQNLVDTGLLTWIVAYAPRPNIELRTVSRDDRSRTYEARHDVSFGGPKAGSASRTARPGPRILDVRLTGDLQFPRNEVAGALQLSPGDRFDFYRWQRDRERLRAFYLDRDHREVRISVRREERQGDGREPGLVLEYDVDPGPRASLAIEGARLPDSVIRELERVWNDAIIDVALADDMALAVRRDLARQGYLQARVDVAQQPTADPGDKRIRVQVETGPQTRSRRVTFVGNMRLSTQELEQAATQVGIDAWLQTRRLADAIALLYQQQGLLNASVVAGPIAFDASGAVLPVRIDEGQSFTIAGIAVRGASARRETDARTDLGLAVGAAYTPEVVRRASRALEAAYAREGFNAMRSTVETDVDRVRGTIALRVAIDEGPQQILHVVDVQGAGGLHEHVVANALDLSTGDPMNLEALYAGRRRLFRTGLFERVDVEAKPIEGAGTPTVEPVRADVTLVRKAPWRLRYGVDVTDGTAPLAEQGRVFGAGLSAGLDRYGLLGRPGLAGATLRINRTRRIARGTLTLPSFFGRAATSNVFISRSSERFEREGFLTFVSDKTAITAEQRFQIRPRVQAAYGYQFERNHVFDPHPDPNALFPLDERLQQTRLTSTLLVDTRSDPFDPRSGLFHASNVEYAPEALGSDVRFVKYSLQQYLFVQPRTGLVLASGIRFGAGRGFGQRLIPSERFFAGGGTTVRGYADNALGAANFLGEPIGGQALVVLNQEVRFPLFRWVRGVAFVDAGSVFDRVRDVSLGGLDVGVGLGMRVSTPIGLFRLDAAMPLPRDQRPLRWWFSLGQAF